MLGWGLAGAAAPAALDVLQCNHLKPASQTAVTSRSLVYQCHCQQWLEALV